jgi:tryptophan synthase beta chain
MAWIIREAPKMKGKTVLMNLSGRGDKDVGQMMSILGDTK